MPGNIHPDDKRPHFFLSYARRRYRPEGSDPDRWVAKLFHDLCEDVSQLANPQVPGFMDRQIRIGTVWRDQLTDALANCRVFVALFSPDYFTSEYCGKEWAAFAGRLERHVGSGGLPPAIIPVWWTRMSLNEVPPSLHAMQNNQPEFPPAYAAEGLYGIMKIDRFRKQYKETVYQLATIIRDRALECSLPASEIPELESLPDPFAEQPRVSRRRPVRLSLAAPSLGELPAGRSPYYYGRTAREWSPYRSPTDTTPIGALAEDVLAELGHESATASIDEPVPEPADSPGVLLVDPWATRDPAIADRLRKIDHEHPVQLLAPFNADDDETTAAEDQLTESLGEVLGNSTALNGSATRIASVQAFRSALPKAVSEAINRFFKTTDTFPPQIPPSTQRPRLQGPVY